MKRKVSLILAAFIVLALAAAAFAEDGQAKTETPLRKEIVKLKYVRATDAYQLLMAYMTQRGRVTMSQDANKTNLLVLSDTPEMVDKMLSLIKEIDVRPAEMQFLVQIVLGSEAPEDKGDESLKNDPIIRELRSVLKYKSFSALDGTTLRVIEGERAETKVGTKGEYSLRLSPKLIRDGAAETINTDIELYRPTWAPMAPAQSAPQLINMDLVRTTLTLKPGERTVVGISKSDADKGLILIISGKVTR